jgi:hypothetical protein
MIRAPVSRFVDITLFYFCGFGYKDTKQAHPKLTLRAAFVMDTPFSNSSARLPISFGYPACPRLEDQAQLFRLLEVEEKLGVRLTEGYMMDPESSVSALVFHNPMARYFSLSPADIERLEREFPEGARDAAAD